MSMRSIKLILAATLAGGLWSCASSAHMSELPAYVPAEATVLQSQEAAPPPRPAAAEEGHGYYNHVAIAAGEFFGGGEDGARFALEYERRIDGMPGFLEDKFGLGIMFDFDTPPVEAGLLAVPFVYHPYEPVSLLIAPGYVFFAHEPDSPVVRLGMKYEFSLSDRLTIAPEMYYDFLDKGRRKGVIAIALGVGF